MTVVEDQQHEGRALEPFATFYARERRAVVGLAYALSGSRLGAEDLAQEAFVAAYRQWDRIGRYDVPGAWVRRVVANRSVSAVRRRLAEARALARAAVRRPARPAELPGDSEELWSLVRALPKRQAQVVALHYVDLLSVAEIAAVLEISPDSVYTHLRRARDRLTEELTRT